jgi:GNAT superfamily N-acetyltransferase
MNTRIRPVEEDDFPRILELFKEFAAFEGHPEMVSNTLELMSSEKEYFHAFIAETSEKKMIGYATYFFSYPTWVGKSLYMDDLYVVPAYRGKGVGSMLIQTLIDFAQNSGCKKMHWQVSDWNRRAVDFYESLGAEIDRNKYNCDLRF